MTLQPEPLLPKAKADLAFGVLVCLSFLIVLLPAITNMPVVGDDAILHLKWIDAFDKMRDAGIFYPRFFLNFQNGLGAPIFYFYPPLAYFLASAFHSLAPASGVNLIFQLVSVFAFVASIVTFYLYAATLTDSRWLRIISSLLYASLPYRFLDAHVRSAFSEHVALAIIPIILLGVELLNRQSPAEKTFNIAALITITLGWAALLMTSIPATAIMAIATPICAWLRVAKPRAQFARKYALGLVAGVALSAIYWLPAMAYMPLLRHTEVFQYPNEFRYPIYFMSQSRADNYVLPSLMLLCSVALIAVMWRRGSKPTLAMLVLGATVQIPFIADPLWSSNMLGAIAYPMRFGMLLCLAIALAFVFESSSRRWLVLAVITLTLIASDYREVKWILNHRATPELDITHEAWDTPGEYSTITPQPVQRVATRQIYPNGDSLVDAERTITSGSYRANFAQRTNVTVDRISWPTWEAHSTTNIELPVRRAANGLLSLELPAGSYDISLRITRGFPERLGVRISLAAAIFLVVATFVYSSRRKSRAA